jgi:hypothetical protein
MKYGLVDNSTINNSKRLSKLNEKVICLLGHEFTIPKNEKHFIEQSISFIIK